MKWIKQEDANTSNPGYELLAFMLGIGLAWAFNWQTGDLVWSLWLCSLVVGYISILSTIAGGILLGVVVLNHPQLPQEKRQALSVVMACLALFLFWFFSLHFCAFHAGHAAFLKQFFPLPELEASDFGRGFMNPLELWLQTFRYVLPAYGAALLPFIFAERKQIFNAFLKFQFLAKKVHTTDFKAKGMPWLGEALQQKSLKSMLGEPFTRPYKNVIRLHLVIIALGKCHAVGIDSFALFVVVYFIYFFPWAWMAQYWKREES